LPEIQIDQFKINISKFDVIVSVAVFMHLNVKEIEQTMGKMKSIATEKGIVIISYSLNRKNSDERHFEPLSREIMMQIFGKFGFIVIDEFKNNDGLSRDIEWVTQVYRIEQIHRLAKVECPSLSRKYK
jgi:cyclopropane fatty-acyl-phospholipid synthase-like methyltransferase